MRRSYRNTARVIAYAIPQPNRRKQVYWAATAGLLTSLAIYALAVLVG